MRRRWLGVVLFVVPVGLYAALGCTVNVTTNTPGVPPPVSKTVGTTGGSVTTSDGSAQVDIPAGALPADTTITISANTSAPSPSGATVVGTPFTFGPDGLKFLKPVTVTLPFDTSKLGSTAPSAIVVYTAPDGSSTYEPLPTTVKDGVHVTATTTHFSTDVAGIGGSKDSSGTDAGGPTENPTVCAQGGAHCAGTSGPGCGAQTPTCQSSGLCAQYPGATVQSCTADATGANATCCFAAGTPTCFHLGGGCGGDGCHAPPTCASASPCAGFPGGTMQSCTDVTGGFDAVCCLPPGSPLPGVGGPAGDGGTTMTDGGGGGSGGDCIIGCGGNSNGTCSCQTTCTGHSYSMTCNGQICSCTQDGTATGSFAQGGTCTSTAQPADAQQGYVTGCHYPGTVTGGAPDGGVTSPDGGGSGGGDGGTGCTPQCGGNGSNCNCNENCNAHAYQLNCTAGTCTCYLDGKPGASSAAGTTCTSPQQTQALFTSQCGAP
jgi:hypothetical protein